MLRRFLDSVMDWIDKEDNPLIFVPKMLFVVAMGILLVMSPFIAYGIYKDNAHPCVEWSELRPETHYVMDGKVLIPVERMGRDCLVSK